MNPNLENPFRPTDKRATKRLFKAGDKQKNPDTKVTKENIDNKMKQTMAKYGPHEILYPQVQFLKELEKLIPKEVLKTENKTAKEILIEKIERIEDGKITYLRLENLNLSKLPDLPDTIEYFDCSFNQLEKLPLLPESLKNLLCEVNHIKELPTLPNSLKQFWCYHNQLTELPPLPESLEDFWCSENPLTEKTKKNIMAHKNGGLFKL